MKERREQIRSRRRNEPEDKRKIKRKRKREMNSVIKFLLSNSHFTLVLLKFTLKFNEISLVCSGGPSVRPKGAMAPLRF